MTAGRHDGGPPLTLPTQPYVCPLPSHQARTMRACSDNMGCASPRTRAVHAGMDVLERRCRSVVVVPTPLALGVALYTTADVAAQVRRCAQLQTRAHGALASHLSLHCASRGKGAARAACWRACTASTCVATHGPALDPASMMTLRAAARSRSPRCVSSRLPLHNVGRRPCAVCDCVAVGLGGWSRGLCTRYSRMNVCVAVGARPLFASVCIAFSNAKSMSAASTSWRRPTCHAYY